MAEETKGAGDGGETGQAAGQGTAGQGAAGHEAGGHEAAGKGETKVTSNVAEKAEGQLNPSSPGNTGTTPGTNAKVG